MSTPETEEERPSPVAGGCMLVGLACVILAAVFAVSPEAGVLAVWAVGAGAVVWAVRRRVSDSSATPPPEGVAPSGDVFAGETGEVDRVEKRVGGVTIVYPKREVIPQEPPN
ncbi:hypothetical protein [Streptomyces sp. NPDC086023]|uniref:hypothetical protein n=1 Tax=Streptomyces sp. NPDC086023 TaxID=3365746 RepID=UPI0037D3D180